VRIHREICYFPILSRLLNAIRSPLLYPAELRAHGLIFAIHNSILATNAAIPYAYRAICFECEARVIVTNTKSFPMRTAQH